MDLLKTLWNGREPTKKEKGTSSFADSFFDDNSTSRNEKEDLLPQRASPTTRPTEDETLHDKNKTCSCRCNIFGIIQQTSIFISTKIVWIWVFLMSIFNTVVRAPKNVKYYFTTFTKNPKFDTENFYSNGSTISAEHSARITICITNGFNNWYRWSSFYSKTGARDKETTSYRDNTTNILQFVAYLMFSFIELSKYVIAFFSAYPRHILLYCKKLRRTRTDDYPENFNTSSSNFSTTTTSDTKFLTRTNNTTPQTTHKSSPNNNTTPVSKVIMGFCSKLRIPVFDTYLFEPCYYIVLCISKKILNLFLRYILFGVLHLCLKNNVFDIFNKNVEQNRSPITTTLLNIFWKIRDNLHFLVLSIVFILFVFYFGGMMKELIWQKHADDTIKTFWENDNNYKLDETQTPGLFVDSSVYEYGSIVDSVKSSFDDYFNINNNEDQNNPVTKNSANNNNRKLSQRFYPSFEKSLDELAPNHSLPIIRSDTYISVVQACFTTCINFEKDSHSSFVKIVDYYKTDNVVNSLRYEKRESDTNYFGRRGVFHIISDICFGLYNTYILPYVRATFLGGNHNYDVKTSHSHSTVGNSQSEKSNKLHNRLFKTLLGKTTTPTQSDDSFPSEKKKYQHNDGLSGDNPEFTNLDILKCKNSVQLLRHQGEKSTSFTKNTIFDDMVLWRQLFKSVCCDFSKNNMVIHPTFLDQAISYHDTVDTIFEWQLLTHSSGNIFTIFSESSFHSKTSLQEKCCENQFNSSSEEEWLLVKSRELLSIFLLNMAGNVKCKKSSHLLESNDNSNSNNEINGIGKETEKKLLLFDRVCEKHRFVHRKTVLPFTQDENDNNRWKYIYNNNGNDNHHSRVSAQVINEVLTREYFIQTNNLLEKSFHNFVNSYMSTRKRLISSVTGMGPENGIYDNLVSGILDPTNGINFIDYSQFLPSVPPNTLELSVCSHIGYNNFKSGFLNFYTNTDTFNENSLWNPAFGINRPDALFYIQKFQVFLEKTKGDESSPQWSTFVPIRNNDHHTEIRKKESTNTDNVISLIDKTSKLGAKLGIRVFDKFKDSINNANHFFESYILSSLYSSPTSEGDQKTNSEEDRPSEVPQHSSNSNSNTVESNGGFFPKQEFERSNLLRNLAVSRFKTLSKNVTKENAPFKYPLFDLLISAPLQPHRDGDTNRNESNTEKWTKSSSSFHKKQQFVLDNTGELYTTTDEFFDNLFRETENEFTELRNMINAAIENFMVHSISSPPSLVDNVTKYMEMLEDVLGYDIKEDLRNGLTEPSKKLVWNMHMCSCSLHHFIFSDHTISAHYQSEVQKDKFTTLTKSHMANFTRGRVRSGDSPIFKTSLLQAIKMMSDKEQYVPPGGSKKIPSTVLYNFQNNDPIPLSGINAVTYPTLSTEHIYNLKNLAKTISSDWKKILNMIVHLPGGPVKFPILYEASLADTFWTNWIDEHVISHNSLYRMTCNTKASSSFSQESGDLGLGRGGDTEKLEPILSTYSNKEQELYINLHKAISVFGFGHVSLMETYDRVINTNEEKTKPEGIQSSKYKKSTIKTSNYHDVMCLDYCNSLLGLLNNLAYLEFSEDYETLVKKDRSQTFDGNTDYPSYYCPREKRNECNNMWKKTDDQFQYQWELVTNPGGDKEKNDENEKADMYSPSSFPKPHSFLINEATFPSPQSGLYDLIKSGNFTYLIDEWFNLAIKNKLVLHNTTTSRKITKDQKDLFFYELSTNLFPMFPPGGSAWFRVVKKRGAGRGLPSPNSKMSHISFYNDKLTAEVLQLHLSKDTITTREKDRWVIRGGVEEVRKRNKTNNYVLLRFNNRRIDFFGEPNVDSVPSSSSTPTSRDKKYKNDDEERDYI